MPRGAASGISLAVDSEHHVRAVIAAGQESRFTSYGSDTPNQLAIQSRSV